MLLTEYDEAEPVELFRKDGRCEGTFSLLCVRIVGNDPSSLWIQLGRYRY